MECTVQLSRIYFTNFSKICPVYEVDRIDGKVALLKGPIKLSKKYLSFGSKIVLGKKVCNFKWCLVLSQIYTKSFGG